MKVRELMEAQGLTVYGLAKKSGMPISTVNFICNQKVDILKSRAEVVYRIAKTLGVSMESLIESELEEREQKKREEEEAKQA
ncbi:MAG: helix-turn-helix transcriptional regulator [Lachnospiraceae bacterium]|nr:helix-turn-helix transcriptional regulator [Lachnospiraceae bacterium]